MGGTFSKSEHFFRLSAYGFLLLPIHFRIVGGSGEFELSDY